MSATEERGRDEWVPTSTALVPPVRHDDQHGDRYSVPVLAVVGGKVWNTALAWDYESDAWVNGDLSDWSDPEDFSEGYEEGPGEVTHWRRMPEPPSA